MYLTIMPNTRANKSVDDWLIAMYCDYGKKGTKRLVRASFSHKAANSVWYSMSRYYSKHGFSCWQEDKAGNIIQQAGG